MNVMTAQKTPEMEALKTRLKATWMSGDYGHFATYLETGALEVLSRIQIEPGRVSWTWLAALHGLTSHLPLRVEWRARLSGAVRSKNE